MTSTSAITKPLAALLTRLGKPPHPELNELISKLCTALVEGHVCLLHGQFQDADWLRGSSLVGGGKDFTPLVLDECGLYLRRYFEYETHLAQEIYARSKIRFPAFDEAVLEENLGALFPDADGDKHQRLAARRGINQCFSVITGGPGTGKTYTATATLVLIARQAAISGTPHRIALAAPSGKAAARISELLQATLRNMQGVEDIRDLLPQEAFTLHRLLGLMPGSTRPRHCKSNLLPYDTVIVDEASMVDLPLMAKLIGALRPDARLLLIGDRDQLASVEAGNVLGDICCAGQEGVIPDCVTELIRTRRFDSQSGIATFATMIKNGDAESAIAFLRKGGSSDFTSIENGNVDLPIPEIAEDFAKITRAKTPIEALASFSKFRVLCTLNAGPFGVHGFNERIERTLDQAGHIRAASHFYRGRPILILRNDYAARVFNGDTGIIIENADGTLLAAIANGKNEPRLLPPARLPKHETAYAMTVHKAQGSEFSRVCIVLPREDHPMLSKELLYTAITRAKEHVQLIWSEASLRSSIARSAARGSGLRHRIHQVFGKPSPAMP